MRRSRNHLLPIGLLLVLLAGVGCGDSTQTSADVAASAELVEDAAAMAALSDGEGTDLSESLASFDLDAAAEEDVDVEGLEGEDYTSDCRFIEFRRHVVDEYDANDDGELDADERAALRDDFGIHPIRRRWHARHHHWRRLQWIYDADDSLALDEAERDTLRMDLETRCMNREAWFLAEFDADDSGDLDEDEWATALEDLAARRAAHRDAFVENYDENEDGRVDAFERLQARSDRLDAILALHDRAIEKYDTNEDGRLSSEELVPLRDVLKERVEGTAFLDRIVPDDDDDDDDDDDEDCKRHKKGKKKGQCKD